MKKKTIPIEWKWSKENERKENLKWWNYWNRWEFTITSNVSKEDYMR